MREYGQIQIGFFSHPDIHALSDGAKLLAVYVLTGPHSNGLGCYRLPDGYVSADLGWSSETISKRFSELFDIGFCKRCDATQFVLIPNFLRWNPLVNPNTAKAREKEYEAIPSLFSYLDELAGCLKRFGKHWSNRFMNLLETVEQTVPDTVPDGVPDNHNHNHNHNQNQTKPKNKSTRTSGKFTPPTLEEIAAYCQERGNAVSAEKFLAHYEANGWRVGRNPMRDWRAAVRTWEHAALDRPSAPTQRPIRYLE